MRDYERISRLAFLVCAVISSLFSYAISNSDGSFSTGNKNKATNERPCPPCIWKMTDDELEKRFDDANVTIPTWEQMKWIEAEHKRCGCVGPDLSAKTMQRVVDQYNKESRKHSSFQNITMSDFFHENRRIKRESGKVFFIVIINVGFSFLVRCGLFIPWLRSTRHVLPLK